MNLLIGAATTGLILALLGLYLIVLARSVIRHGPVTPRTGD